ncbi:hypothetical protein B0H11DRAFT_82336 [Mycena galericulata]|nr:hypothetical protein B0H11DRAFT_82336 [Mycena galericulata]
MWTHATCAPIAPASCPWGAVECAAHPVRGLTVLWSCRTVHAETRGICAHRAVGSALTAMRSAVHGEITGSVVVVKAVRRGVRISSRYHVVARACSRLVGPWRGESATWWRRQRQGAAHAGSAREGRGWWGTATGTQALEGCRREFEVVWYRGEGEARGPQTPRALALMGV